MRRGSLRARGQAALEMALGSLVFITLLLFGIHFGEVGVLTLRVQQAATSALWDTTGMRMHNYATPLDSDPRFFNANEIRDSKARLPAQRAQALYKSFDVLSPGGAGTITQAVTRASKEARRESTTSA